MLQCNWKLQHRTETRPSASSASTSTSVRLLQALRTAPAATVSSIVTAAEPAGRQAIPRRRKLFEDEEAIELDDFMDESDTDSVFEFVMPRAAKAQPVPPLTFRGMRQPLFNPDRAPPSTSGSMRASSEHTGSMHANQHLARPEVHVFWDVDNKHPDWVPPEDMVENIRSALSGYGDVSSMQAYANQNTARWVPPSVAEERREARQEMEEEARAFARGEKPVLGPKGYRCEMCGAGFPTAEKLQRHFKQLHEREFVKRQNHKHNQKRKRKPSAKEEAKVKKYLDAREAVLPKKPGDKIGLSRRLGSCGVQVTIVPSKPQAADAALLGAAQRLLASLRVAHLAAGQQQQEGAPGPSAVVCVISDDRGLVKPLMRACEAAECALVVICARPRDMADALQARQQQQPDPGPSHLIAILDFRTVQHGEYVVPVQEFEAGAQHDACAHRWARRPKRGLAVRLVPQRGPSSVSGAVRRRLVWRLRPVALSSLCNNQGYQGERDQGGPWDELPVTFGPYDPLWFIQD